MVLPLLEAKFVPPIDITSFLAGYGVAQAVPGPLFSFAAFIGTVLLPESLGWAALIAVIAIFLPVWFSWSRYGRGSIYDWIETTTYVCERSCSRSIAGCFSKSDLHSVGLFRFYYMSRNTWSVGDCRF